MPKTNLPAGTAIKPGDTRVIRRNELPSPGLFGPGAVLVWDRRLSRKVPGFSRWRQAFPAALGVEGGEGLKEMDAFPALIARLLDLTAGFSRREIRLVAVGGGSVGDFAGFAAGIMKRGVELIHLPSTWLAAVDSAHGGKNALNVARVKNQVGLFYFPARVYLVKELLFSGPEQLAKEGLGELLKAGLLAGGEWFAALERSRLRGAALLWRHLLAAVKVKNDIVGNDPEERLGARQVLNFGHTVGHLLEVHYGWSHGIAVAQGMYFALAWSRKKVGLSEDDYQRCCRLLQAQGGFAPALGLLPRPQATVFRRWLGRDKKATGKGRVTFIFLQGPGVVMRKSVMVEEVVKEALRQKVIEP